MAPAHCLADLGDLGDPAGRVEPLAGPVFADPWLALAVYLAILLTIVGLGELARARLGASPETTRKLVHVLVGLTLAPAPFVSPAAWPLLALGALFVAVNGVTLRASMRPRATASGGPAAALAGMHGTARLSYGTVFFPLAFLALTVLYFERDPAIFTISMVILALADTMGTVVGEAARDATRFRWWRDPKSVPGSVAVGMTSAAVVLALLPWFEPVYIDISTTLTTAAVCAVICVCCEGASRRGSDNLSLTLGAALTLELLRAAQGALGTLLAWFVAAAALALAAWRLRLLTSGGAVGALLVGWFLFGAQGLAGAVPLLAFFVLSSALSKLADHERPGEPADAPDKGSRRDIVQVFANGGVATICALAGALADPALAPAWYGALVAALAAANADTWATEIGRFARARPRRLWPPFDAVEPGTSGGVTALGTLGALAGAAVLTACAAPFLIARGFGLAALALVMLTGFAASLIDSLLGATVQVRFRDPVTNTPTEWAPPDVDHPRVISGARWMDNDAVNLTASALAAAAALALLAPTT